MILVVAGERLVEISCVQRHSFDVFDNKVIPSDWRGKRSMSDAGQESAPLSVGTIASLRQEKTTSGLEKGMEFSEW